MRYLIGVVLGLFVLCGAPASAQALMKDFSWTEMKAEVEKAGAAITREDITEETRYVVGKDDTGLNFGVYGMECDSKEITQRCRGADLIASFTLKDATKADYVLTLLDYAAVSDYRDDEGHVKISRYVIFDHGITPENLQTNISVFLDLANETWDMLGDEELLK